MTNEQLRKLRAKLKWTQQDMADHVQVGHRTVQWWESGKVRIPSIVDKYFKLYMKSLNDF